MKFTASLCLAFALAVCSPARAIDDEEAGAEALQKTTALLRDRKAREDYAKSDKNAAAALSGARSTVGGDAGHEDELFDQSAAIFETIAAEAKNDPQKIQEIMAELQKNPRALESRMTDSQKQRLRDLASKVAAPKAADAKSPR